MPGVMRLEQLVADNDEVSLNSLISIPGKGQASVAVSVTSEIQIIHVLTNPYRIPTAIIYHLHSLSIILNRGRPQTKCSASS